VKYSRLSWRSTFKLNTCITLTVNNNSCYSVALLAGWSTKWRLLSVCCEKKRDVYIPSFLTSVSSRLLRLQYFVCHQLLSLRIYTNIIFNVLKLKIIWLTRDHLKTLTLFPFKARNGGVTRDLATKLTYLFKVCKSVHHRTIEIKSPTRCNNFPG